MAKLKIVPRVHGNKRGKQVYPQIINAAFDVLVEHGLDAVTLVRVAEECNMKAGNLNYYFASKEDLINDLIRSIVNTYEDLTDGIRNNENLDPEGQLREFIELVLDDMQGKETAHVFPELWAAANHNEFFRQRLYELYEGGYQFLISLIKKINPDLSREEREAIALFIQAATEGMTIFAGYGKRGSARIGIISRVASDCLVTYVKSARPQHLRDPAVRKAMRDDVRKDTRHAPEHD
jgi:AcrR family transcriptional regulator